MILAPRSTPRLAFQLYSSAGAKPNASFVPESSRRPSLAGVTAADSGGMMRAPHRTVAERQQRSHDLLLARRRISLPVSSKPFLFEHLSTEIPTIRSPTPVYLTL